MIMRNKPDLSPRCLNRTELRGPHACDRSLKSAGGERSPEGSSNERDLRRFKQMHFCALRMQALAERYGDAASEQPDYRQFSKLYRELRNEIAHENLGLVYDVYRRRRFANVNGDDLISDGMMALGRAISTFDPWRGFRFSTYAWNVIVRAFYCRARRESKRRTREPVSFDSELEKGDLPEVRREEESWLYVERLEKILQEGKVTFTETENGVLRRRFPMDPGAEPLTLSAVGREMHLSKERVRQIQNAALRKLRGALDADPLLN
jgi:RNA polymerase sigma factor (sigma-70 family)